jgi:HPt (histidine-containing phosphotransfer) domain-containing protein
MDENPHIDEAVLAKLHELGDTAFVVEMIDAFFMLMQRSCAEARSALEVGQLEPVIRMGHSLKSSARVMGARTLQDIATQVERHAREHRFQELSGLLDQFDQASLGVKAHLEILRASMTSRHPDSN